MKKFNFTNGLIQIEKMYEHSYNKILTEAIWGICQKWREETWTATIGKIVSNFKPTSACKLPVPADFVTAKNEINMRVDSFERPESIPETPEDIAGWNEYQKIVSELLSKWNGNKKEKGIKTSFFNGVYICEACHRKGCDGKSNLEKCFGFLSEEEAKKIERSKMENAIDSTKN